MSGGAKVVAIGGGHGLARALSALRLADVEPTAVVTVADDGGSTGRLRRDLGIIAPGDLRMALLTLARDHDLAAALAHRFERGELAGHPLGNLLLVALAEQAGGEFVAALARAGRLLDCAGQVLPATLAPVELKARVSGRQVDGQVRVAQTNGRVERVWLEPAQPAACEEAVGAIGDADLVVLGPGSLFTSVIAPLLVPGIAEAVAATPARRVYLCNLLTQPGETAGLSAQAHVAALLDAVPGLWLDWVVAHDGPPALGRGDPVGDVEACAGVGAVISADIAARTGPGGHDPERLFGVLQPLVVESAPQGTVGT